MVVRWFNQTTAVPKTRFSSLLQPFLAPTGELSLAFTDDTALKGPRNLRARTPRCAMDEL